MELDTSGWSGEGAFTQVLVEALRAVEGVSFVRVEDAPASRSDADYNFISNEIFIGFALRRQTVPTRYLGFIPGVRHTEEKALTMERLDAALRTLEAVGPPDYADASLIQYLRTERIVPPYQTKGYKLVELVRLYEAGTGSRR